jgi:antitoxin HigA-1
MNPMHNPAHPGEVLRVSLPAGLALSEAAKRLGVTRQSLSALVNGRAGMSASMALRLEAVFGTSAEMWLSMQSTYDLWQARQQPPKIKPVAASAMSSDAEPKGTVSGRLAAMIDTLRVPIAVLCERHGVRELALFGSILRDDFDTESSDVDAAVAFGPARGESLARQYFDFKASLEQLLARPVDLVEIDAMPDTRLKRIIERTKVPIYAAAA